MADLVADIALLESADASLVAIAAAARDGLSVLQAEVGALLGLQWRGGAADGFDQGWREWEQGVLQLLEALDSLGGFLGNSGAAYERADGDLAVAASAGAS